MQRPDILQGKTWGMPGATLSASGSGEAVPERTKSFLLVHGAWHCGAHWTHVSAGLAARGHRVLAVDLPGAGLNATYPDSFINGDQAALATEPSPLAGLTMAHYRDAVVAQVRALATHGKVTLVSHSMGGMTATAVAEAVPELIARLVYVTALVPVRFGNVVAYADLPEFASAQTSTLFYGNPAAIGAIRINPRSPDAAYRERARQTFYNDLSAADFPAFAALLGPDIPAQVALGDARGTPSRWGRVPRTFVRCLQDRSQPLAGQDLLIADADAATPGNRFDVKTLDTGHSPFATRPAELVTLLDALE
ncbi:alpha/beta fold hydrolase [Hydrogenophaga sp.]|uniref:alpha/beta fold hydrolase n=1 Tax=Hydrogenophaga sp. TaxID=1904254 RepID=UPI002FC79DA2